MQCHSWCGENGSFSAQCTFYLSHSTQVATVFRKNTVSKNVANGGLPSLFSFVKFIIYIYHLLR